MNFTDLIIKKRSGGELSSEEIDFFIKGVTERSLPDYQISAMLMAICIKSLNYRETADLTMAMAHSGRVLDLSDIDGIKVDKHSTGGVADTTTLILAPLTASLGLKVIKMSGRGLGHTGGTIDKLESIPGFNTALGITRATEQVNNIGIAVMGQTEDLAPADKYLYALRDVTGTVESIPLIAASIMSKKLAAGSDAIVLDVKYGSGAFMKTLEDAQALARTMVSIGLSAGKKTTAVITPMDRPLGDNIGNSLEVIEAIEILKGKKDGRLKKVALELAAHMLVLGGIANDRDTALYLLDKNIENGRGLEKFEEMISAQGGDPNVCEDYLLFPQTKCSLCIKAKKSGCITEINTTDIGRASVALGAGRLVKDTRLDLSAGIIMHTTLGEHIAVGDIIAEVFAADNEKCTTASDIISKAITISDREAEPLPLFGEV